MATFKDRAEMAHTQDEFNRQSALDTARQGRALNTASFGQTIDGIDLLNRPQATGQVQGGASAGRLPSMHNPTPDVSGVGGALGDAWRWITE